MEIKHITMPSTNDRSARDAFLAKNIGSLRSGAAISRKRAEVYGYGFNSLDRAYLRLQGIHSEVLPSMSIKSQVVFHISP